jgi:hypothetical protein
MPGHQRPDGQRRRQVPHLVRQQDNFLLVLFCPEAAWRLGEFHERVGIHRAGEHSYELPNGPRKRERDARLDIYPANAPPIGFQWRGERLGDFTQLSGLGVEVHDRPTAHG